MHHHFTTDQMAGRDRDAADAVARHAGDPVKQEEVMKARGSKGETEHAKAGLGYWDVKMHAPFAVYRCTYLGIAKDFLKCVLVRLKMPGMARPEHGTVLPFARPTDTRRLLDARRKHVVLRASPNCKMANIFKHVGSMSMSEIQLVYEVLVPYLVHDLVACGVPQEVCAMWLLLRFGMMQFTRLLVDDVRSHDQYQEQLQEARAAMLVYATIAQHYVSTSTIRNAHDQFRFAWKLHVTCAHLHEMIMDTGHPIQASDTWVEQLMRSGATKVCK